MEPAQLSREARVASWRVFALVLLSASYFFQSSGHNEAARFDQIRSVAEHGEWWIDRYTSNTADVIQVNGHTYPNKAPGTTWLGLAPWKAARLAAGALPIDEPKQLVLVTYLLTLLMAALPTAFTSLMILRFLSRSGWTIGTATLTGVGYGVGSMAFPWATTFFSHQLAAFFAFGAFYLVWSGQGEEPPRPRARLLLAGWMMGFLPVIEYPAAIASGLIGVYAIRALRPRSIALLFAGAVMGVLPLPLYNMQALGSPFVLSYSFYKEGSTFPAHQQGFIGVSWPRFEVLQEITFRARRGLFHANPWLALGLLAPFFLKKLSHVRAEFLLAASIFAAALFFNSGFGDSIVYWGGAFSFGPRHILFALPFAAVLAAASMKSRVLAPLTGALIVVTSFLMLTVAAIDPRLPYEPAEPFVDFYLPLYLRGLHSAYPVASFGESVLFESSGAFNLGRALGLPRTLEMLPLTVVWAVAAFVLFERRTRAIRLAQGMAAAVALTMGLWPALARGNFLTKREPGLCQTVSANETWAYLSDYALQAEPSRDAITHRVKAPGITLPGDDAMPTSVGSESVAITFEGELEPTAAGWHVVKMEAI